MTENLCKHRHITIIPILPSSPIKQDALLREDAKLKGEVLVELGAWAGMALMGAGICYLIYQGLELLGWIEKLGAGLLLIFIIAGPLGATVLSECMVKYYGRSPDNK